jgi:hypothetical protein
MFVFDRPDNIWRRVRIMQLLIVHFPPFSCYVLRLRSFRSPQHVSQAALVAPSITPIQKQKNRCFVYFHLFVFGQQLFGINGRVLLGESKFENDFLCKIR